MVGGWNRNFDKEIEEDFLPDVANCGCYFIVQEKDMVNQCLGVDLKAFFTLPSSPTNAPTPVSEIYSNGCRGRQGKASEARLARRGQ